MSRNEHNHSVIVDRERSSRRGIETKVGDFYRSAKIEPIDQQWQRPGVVWSVTLTERRNDWEWQACLRASVSKMTTVLLLVVLIRALWRRPPVPPCPVPLAGCSRLAGRCIAVSPDTWWGSFRGGTRGNAVPIVKVHFKNALRIANSFPAKKMQDFVYIYNLEKISPPPKWPISCRVGR